MFEAFVIVCAADFAYEINYDTCISVSDSWGPYVTEENCDIRIDQMMEEILRGELNPIFFYMYHNSGIPAENLYAEGYCNKLSGEEA